jgi:hypothetical protein
MSNVMTVYGDGIFNAENITDEEWVEYAAEQRKRSREREQQKMQNWSDDVWDFYANASISNYDRKAYLADNKGIDWVYGLADFDGKVLDADIVDGKYGQVWRIRNEDGSVSWVNVSRASTVAKEQAHYAKKGVKMVTVYYRWSYGSAGVYADKSRGVVEVVEMGDEE